MILINNRDKIEWFEGMTVRDVFRIMNYNYSLITVSVNDVFVPEEDYESFIIPDNANVIAFHLAHGG